MQVTKEMKAFFWKRTNEHIDRVQKNAQKLYETFKYRGLLAQALLHDQSKLLPPELTLYIVLTWKYKCKQEKVEFFVSNSIDKKIQEAAFHHVKSNRHHPEFHDLTFNAPSDKIINATLMPDVDIAEMVCDWVAMSQELNTDPFEWAKNNVNNRWKFTAKQEALIYNFIRVLRD